MNFVTELKKAKNDGHLPNIEIEFIDDYNAIIGDYKIHNNGSDNDNPMVTQNFISRKDTGEVVRTFDAIVGTLENLNIGQCEDCGKLFELDDELYHFIENTVFCDDCYNRLRDNGEIVCCCDCGYETFVDNLRFVDSFDDYICQSCLDENYDWCEYCEDYHCLDDMREVIEYNGDHERCGSINVCCNCVDNDEIFYCEECGEYFLDPDDIHNVDEDGYHYCFDCAPISPPTRNINKLLVYNDINCYHPNIPLTPISHKNKIEKIDNFKGYGIELEVDKDSGWTDRVDEVSTLAKLNNIAGGHMYFSHDCSLENGFEIVTQPHTEGAMHKIDWKSYLKVLKDAGYKNQSRNAGYHIHISRLLFGDTENKQNDNIAKLLYFFENNKSDLLKMSRRVESQYHWCQFYSDRTYDFIPKEYDSNGYASAFEKFDTKNKEHYEVISDKSKRLNRLRGAVNIGNRNTVEIRLFRSTLDYNDFMASFDFITTLVKNVNKITWKNIDDTSKWLENAPESVTKYIKKKGVLGVCA